MCKAIHDMGVPELASMIQSKKKEYMEAIKTKKVFWEIKKIVEQKRSMEKELLKKQNDGSE